MIIREEQPADCEAIRAVVAAAFGQRAEADLVDELRADGDAVVSLVAIDEGQVVGHVMFSRMAAPFLALGLAPVAVLPGHECSGVGSALIRAGLEAAKGDGWQGVFVLGEPGYYRRFGFEPALAQGFDCAYSGPYLMALALGDALPVMTGRVEYAAAFGRLPPE
jgi:putative acetyltransferase